MKQVTLDKEEEKRESKDEQALAQYREMIAEGAKTDYGKAVKKIIEEELEEIVRVIDTIQNEELKTFCYKGEKQQQVLHKMSTRYNVRKGVEEILTQIQRRLF